MKDKKKRKNKADLGDDFVPPDGGWGWIVCIASGLTNIFMFPVFQFFGLIFRDRFAHHGITNQQISIMINTQMGFGALSGFFYGPIFRTFAIRKVAIFGSIQLISGIFCLSQIESYPFLFIIYVFYTAVGKELVITAKQMAFNTYFKEKRRKALSIVAGIPSVGNIIMPFFVTFLMKNYTSSGTLLILCAFAGNVLVASLTYQPVKWHLKKKKNFELEGIELNTQSLDENHKDDVTNTENEDKQTPEENKLIKEEQEQANLNAISLKPNENEQSNEQCEAKVNANTMNEKTHKKSSYFRVIFEFFDADLMKDLSFINICFGLSCSMLVEQNFKVLAPFFLKDFDYSDNQIALAMAIGQIPDLITKIAIPHVLEFLKIKWTNRTLWVFCVFGMMIGEIIIAQNPSYNVIIFFMFVEGIFSGAKSIFTGMLIPDHVLLKKMPAAFGINRFITGLLMIALGPVVGGIRDRSNYTLALLFLNFLSLLIVALWSCERCIKLFRTNN